MNTYRVVALGMIAAAVLAARSHHSSQKAQGAAGQIDYYVLSLSWAPDFCATAGNDGNAKECGAGRHVRFVVHGLWPQNHAGRGPENCGPASPVAAPIVRFALEFYPTAGLVQHEWTAHGTCSGLSTNDYFNAVAQTRTSVQIPVQFTSMTEQMQEGTSQIEGQFATANPSFPAQAFRATCTQGNLQEVRVCFSKSLAPAECTASAGECTAPGIKILAPR